MQAHDLARWIVQKQIKIIKGNDGRESLREVVKQPVQIPVCGDGLGDIEESLAWAMLDARLVRSKHWLLHNVKHIHVSRARSSRKLSFNRGLECRPVELENFFRLLLSTRWVHGDFIAGRLRHFGPLEEPGIFMSSHFSAAAYCFDFRR